MTDRFLLDRVTVVGPGAASGVQRGLDWLALVFTALVFLLPFVQPIHRPPQPVFDSEWTAAILLAVTAIALGAQRSRSVALNLPLPFWLVCMIAVVVLQRATGMLKYPSQLPVACMYAFATFGGYWVGRALLTGGLRDRIFPVVAIGLLVGAIFSVAVQLTQLFNVSGLPDWLFVQIDDPWYRTRPFANLAQANHLATYLIWALFAALYLHDRKLPLRATVVVVLVIAIGLALTRSRMGILFTAAFIAACWIPSAMRPVARNNRLSLTIAMVLGYIAGSFAVSLMVAYQGTAVDTAFGRFNEGGGISIRLGMWADAIKVAADHALSGAGFGQYAASQYWLPEPSGVSTIYVHNVILQTAAELGLPLAAGLGVLGIWWACTALGERRWVKESAFAWALLAVLALHALLEWPLSTLQFIVPAALLFALAEPKIGSRFGTAGIGSRVLLAAGVVGLFLATTMKLEFDEASDLYYRAEAQRNTTQGISDGTLSRLLALSESSLLRIYPDTMLVSLRAPTAVAATEDEIKRHERLLINGADPRLIGRLVILHAKAGHIDQSVRHAERLGVFRGDQYDKQSKLILDAIERLGPEADPLRRQLALGAAGPAKAAGR